MRHCQRHPLSTIYNPPQATSQMPVCPSMRLLIAALKPAAATAVPLPLIQVLLPHLRVRKGVSGCWIYGLA